jgi:hypothetical protein
MKNANTAKPHRVGIRDNSVQPRWSHAAISDHELARVALVQIGLTPNFKVILKEILKSKQRI